MKLLLISEECGTGSTGRICTDIATLYEKYGNEVKIAFGRNAESIPKQYEKFAVRIGNNADLLLHVAKARLFDKAGFGSKRATKKFIEWIKDYDPDIIHLHNIHGYYINIELLFNYLKCCRKRIIWTLHDVWAFTGHSAYCDAAQCEKWKKGCEHCPQLNVYPKSFIDRSLDNWERKRDIFQGVSNLTIVTPSNWLAELVKESYLKDYTVSVINNGVNTKLFTVRDSGFKKANGLENKKILLSVASVWNNLKGLDDFFALSSQIDDDYLIVLVGSMDKKDVKRLPHNIIHINKTQNIDEMVDIYNAADIYINLTKCDTYPTVNLEAAACGLPIISFDVGGSTESTLQYGGRVVKRDDINAVINAISECEKNKASSRSSNVIDYTMTIKRYMDLYYD